MKKLFSIASWNVEHFKNDPARIDLIIDFLKIQNPDVFALYEVESAKVYDSLVTKLPDYSFHITEGTQVQEILVGANKKLTTFFTQKMEFKSGDTYLRPGALLTVRLDNLDYPILFLHTKSANSPIGLGIRDDMFERAFKLKKYLDEISKKAGKGISNFIFLGDLNIMGMEYPFDKKILADIELKKIAKNAQSCNMVLLTKTSDFTWWNGPSSKLKPSNLDQVVASKQLKFTSFNGKNVDVRGWVNEKDNTAKADWIKKYSDHSLLYLQLEKK
ncbi:MAG: hypothetical protein NTX22_13815 [Ignavibacteriales bacterium]|nr:hypothetical protein [Ignavibacteriales bacterium]